MLSGFNNLYALFRAEYLVEVDMLMEMSVCEREENDRNYILGEEPNDESAKVTEEAVCVAQGVASPAVFTAAVAMREILVAF